MQKEAETILAVLADRIAERVISELTKQDVIRGRKHGPDPRAMTTAQICDRFSVSEGMVKKLRRHGLPCFFIGDSPRFDCDQVLTWLQGAGSLP